MKDTACVHPPDKVSAIHSYEQTEAWWCEACGALQWGDISTDPEPDKWVLPKFRQLMDRIASQRRELARLNEQIAQPPSPEKPQEAFDAWVRPDLERADRRFASAAFRAGWAAARRATSLQADGKDEGNNAEWGALYAAAREVTKYFQGGGFHLDSSLAARATLAELVKAFKTLRDIREEKQRALELRERPPHPPRITEEEWADLEQLKKENFELGEQLAMAKRLLAEPQMGQAKPTRAEAIEWSMRGEPAPSVLAWSGDEDPGACPICGVAFELVRPGKSQPTCSCQDDGSMDEAAMLAKVRTFILSQNWQPEAEDSLLPFVESLYEEAFYVGVGCGQRIEKAVVRHMADLSGGDIFAQRDRMRSLVGEICAFVERIGPRAREVFDEEPIR